MAKEEDSEALLEQLYISRCRPRVELCLNPCHLDPEVLDVPGWQVPHLDAGVENACLPILLHGGQGTVNKRELRRQINLAAGRRSGSLPN